MSRVGFIDAKCVKCSAHVGWFGSMANKPACRKCGFREPQSDLDEAEKLMNAYFEKAAKERRARDDKEWAEDQPDASKHYLEGQLAFASTPDAHRLAPLDIPSPYVATKTPDGKFWQNPHRWWMRGWNDARKGEIRLVDSTKDTKA